jgi:hypothetical protein
VNQVSDSLHALAEDVTFPESDLVVEVGERVRRRRRRTRALLSATTAVVVILLGFGIAAMSLNVRSTTGQPATCPHSLGAWQFGPQRPGTKDMLVPPGPVSATVCRYDPSPSGPGATPPAMLRPDDLLLTRSASLTEAQVQQVAAELNRQRRGDMSCPMNPTSVLLLRFGYPGGPEVDVTMGIAGCWNGGNGSFVAIMEHVSVPGFTG